MKKRTTLPKEFAELLKIGDIEALEEQDIVKIRGIIKVIYNGNCNEICDELTPYAVAWVLLNQEVIPHISPNYER